MSDITILGIFVADISFSGDKIPESGETILGDKYNIGPIWLKSGLPKIMKSTYLNL